ncbi:primase-helicase family protein [Maribacter dokdonensis]|uniref:primase-helicase family protein n=1 Tax=Maribacter dokdonensis TaxID=320912 RepID=UPI0007199343|nr:DUF5906 domain-containing protein [Maribacter dokdonensis]KSA14187.1 hypothetical protein I600_780 [Maribacter dokdonensis DSW-8]
MNIQLKEKPTYIRIGTEYYKIVEIPLFSGDSLKTIKKWKKSEIITDEGRDALSSIKKYDGFCFIPSHTNYQQEIKNFYNQYEEIDIKPKPGDFTETINFLTHIFGEQLEIGLDYLTIIWRYPTQILPILCLVSDERHTGKTTFLNWLKLIFQGNMTINKNEDFRSRFNADWASKSIVAVDEVLLDKKEDSERIKNLSTAVSYKTESKGVDKVESFFIGKFILCSNNETNFIQVDEKEIRYWVIKVHTLPQVNGDPKYLDKLRLELPHFIDHLNKRKISSPNKTRMWFTKQQIHTTALEKLVNGNRTYLDKEIQEIILDDFIKYEVDEISYSLGDLVDKLSKNNIRTSTFKISDALRTKFGLTSTNGSYSKYSLILNNKNEYIVVADKSKGRYFTFLKKDLEESIQ